MFLGLAGRGIPCHLFARITDEKHVVLTVGKIPADQGPARPGGRFPVNIVDIIPVVIFPQVIKIETPPVHPRLEITVQQVRCLSFCIEFRSSAHSVQIIVI